MAKNNSQIKEDILAKILRWSLFAIAGIPLLIFKDFLSPFHFGKVVVFRASIEVMAILYILLVMKDRKYLPRTNGIFWAFTAFVAVFGITTIFSVDVYQSFVGALERMGGWFTMLHFWILFVIATSIFRTREDWIRWIQVSIFVSLISSFYGFLQKTEIEFIVGGGNRARIFGTIGNTALFAGYTLANLFLALSLLLKKNIASSDRFWFDTLALAPIILLWAISSPPFFGVFLVLIFFALSFGILYGIIYALGTIRGDGVSFLRFLYAMGVLVGIVAVLMTAVRGSLAGLIISLALFAFAYLFTGSSKKIKIAFVSIATILIIAEGLLILSHNSDFVQSSGYLRRVSDISLKTRLINTRFWAWQAGIDGWNDSAKTIILGWGPENFNVPFSIHFNPNFFLGPGSETLFDRAHNMFVEVLVTMGLLGIFAYLFIFVIIFNSLRKIWKNSEDPDDKNIALALSVGTIAYMIHNSLIFDTSSNFIMFFMTGGFISTILLSQKNEVIENKALSRSSSTMRYSTAVLLSIIVIFSIYKTSIKPVQANYATTRALLFAYAQEYPLSLEHFRKALAYESFPIYEVRHHFAQFVLNNFGSFKEEDGLSAGPVIVETIKEVEKNKSHKFDYLPHLYTSRLYLTLGSGDPKSKFNDEALASSMKALEISPTFVRTYYEVAQAYLNKKDYDTAIEWFQKSIDLNPEVGISWFYKGISELQGGNIEQALLDTDKGLTLGHDATEGQLNALIQIYAERRDYEKIASLYERLIRLKPEFAQYHAAIATVYVQIGRIDEAIAEARKATELDPKYEPEARKFVESLGRTW